MEDMHALDEMINAWKIKFSEKEIRQEDLNWINAIARDSRSKILEAIPSSEEVFSELCIDEDMNGNLFFTKST